MAKSLRAKCKKPHKIIKRTTLGTAYQATEAARLQRLNIRLSQKLNQPVAREEEDPKEDEGVEGDDAAMKTPGEGEAETQRSKPEDGGAMAVDGEPSKISTSGSRNTSQAVWRKARGITRKKGRNFTTFSKKQAFH